MKKHPRSAVPLKRQRIFNVSVRDDLLPWWDGEVEPLIKKMGVSRSAFVMTAVKEFVTRQK